MTAICVPIFVGGGSGGKGEDLEQAVAEAEEALAGLDRKEALLELRCDTATPRQMLEAIDLANLPLIVTVRPTWEGGRSQKSDKERITLWEQAIEAGAEHIDVELVSWEKSKSIREGIEDLAEKNGTRLILSNHNFEGRPDFADRLARLRSIKAAHILKIAWKSESLLDALHALQLIADNKKLDGRPLISLAMGEQGMLSRILAKKFSAHLTFAAVRHGKESAPGQPTVDELLTRYRWKKQTPDSPLFGVVGWPVGHSLSPLIHNAAFDELNLPGVYVPLPVQSTYEAFQEAADALRNDPTIHLRGFSVTIPHKENAIRYAREKNAVLDPLSDHIGVVNTLHWNDAGTLSAFNFDYAGALDALVQPWGGNRESLSGKKIAILGAGGAARAIVAGLAAYNAHTTIFNRTFEKAQSLAADFNNKTGPVVAAPWSDLSTTSCDALINCTPLGMHPKTNASPIDFDPAWDEHTVIFDTIYNPLHTQLLKLAKKKNAILIPGIDMFVGQAALQFQTFTGKPAPAALFRTLLLDALQK